MTDVQLVRAVRDAARTISLSLVLTAVTVSVLLPISAAITARVVMQWQMESLRQQLDSREQQSSR